MNRQLLDNLRKKLETIDDQIVDLLDQRMIVAGEVGFVKDALELPLSDSQHEKAIFCRLQKRIKHSLLRDYVENIFLPIFECAKGERKLRKKKRTSIKKIGILGHGLIGGSILRALKTQGGKLSISAVARDDLDFEQAWNSGLIDNIFSTLKEMVSEVDCLVLAVPITEVLSLASEIANITKGDGKGLLVVDVASVKGEIATVFESLTHLGVEFVATHPMAGSEKMGFSSSMSSLFIDAPWVITPHTRNSKKGVAAIKSLVKLMGARPVIMEASQHDKYAALLSHVPGILAKSYLDFVDQLIPNVEDLCGPGFRSFTRVAHSNPRMRKEIAKANKKEIDLALSQWGETIGRSHE